MSQKCILVAGGAGFIGSNVNKLLNEAGFQTVVFDNLSHGCKEAVTRGLFVQGDLADKAALEKLFKEHHFDAVMHFAASIDVGESIVNPAKYYNNNVVNMLNLLEAMRQQNVSKIIFSSSAAVYGIPQQKYLTEDHPCSPINPYGQTKLMGEKILADYAAVYPLTYCALRYFNAAGGDPDGEVKNYSRHESNLIPIIIKSAYEGNGKVTIFGTNYETRDGTCVRDYIHVYDLATAHIIAMKQLLDGASSSVYNLGNGRGFSVREVITAAQGLIERPLTVIEGPRRPGDPAILVADASKARKALDWQPRYPDIKDIVSHALKALLEKVGLSAPHPDQGAEGPLV